MGIHEATPLPQLVNTLRQGCLALSRTCVRYNKRLEWLHSRKRKSARFSDDHTTRLGVRVTLRRTESVHEDFIGSCLHPVTKSTCFQIRLQHVRVPIRQQYIHDPIKKVDSLAEEYSLHRSNPHDEAYWHDHPHLLIYCLTSVGKIRVYMHAETSSGFKSNARSKKENQCQHLHAPQPRGSTRA